MIKKNTLEQILDKWFVDVPPGKVQMRDDRISESWSEEVSAFQLGKFPVTQELFVAVTGQNPSAFKGEKLPVETVSWSDAATFCNQLSDTFGKEKCYTFDTGSENVDFNVNANGFRLPTEAEWQYACQAGKKGVRYGELKDIAWFKENSEKQPQQVGQKLPNELGLHDMLGNVWEWCSDIYDETVYGSYRILRGGGWCDEERSVMATTRRRSHPFSFKIDDLGFRIARNKPNNSDK